ncbi:histone-like nucleoid-structuring protein, MvaT/MvaU family [Marinobacter salarius]|uniref:H-NS histone n=1 Tax=Marinobacter salarius TaxID=1420917 RepID=A0A1W6KG33_9GAMM|nr:histone-like nucleoid-structuring protein, MvaT/MvaU family [Marinobacter salarius]ARM86279.1 H-NS histone [Marinobacter salarius]
MAKINDYYQKRQLIDQLADELQALENDQALKAELKFEKDVKALMDQYNKAPSEVLQILAAIDPTVTAKGNAAGQRAKRPLVTYKNPHTGESVKTRGGNHKTLKEWRNKYGKETVKSWAS